MVDEEVSAFLKRFGTYLQIHACLVYSAKVEARQAIDRLLDVARFDPLHREATKELRKATGMTFYEAVSELDCFGRGYLLFVAHFYLSFVQTKLSALLVALRNLRHDKEPHREIIKNLCVAAYPDVQPWQVRVALLDSSLADESKTAMSHSDCQDLYYKYLSELLDPSDGHESARRNSKLVKVSCKVSPYSFFTVHVKPDHKLGVFRNGANGRLDLGWKKATGRRTVIKSRTFIR